MKRILFVDDEPNVLDGLRDTLRKQRKHWEMAFALGGKAALAELEKGPFDVIVSDMRMPGIDGAQLLALVKAQYPATARLILSGQADRDSVMKALPVAHQFLSKPCDAEALRQVVERTCELQKLLEDEGIRKIIGQLDRLPSAPQTYWELTKAASQANVEMKDLSSIIERDPGMAVKVLQLVNSAYFGLPRRLTSVQQAVSYLGTDLLKALALTVHALGSMSSVRVPGFSMDELTQHSLLAARLSKKLVRDPKMASDAFTASLVHDVGKIVLAIGTPKSFAEIVATARATGKPFHVVEKEVLGLTHAEVGAYLLGFWGLPISIVEAVAYHHSPSLITTGDLDTIAVVHVADALIHAAAEGRRDLSTDARLDRAFVDRLGLTPQLPNWLELAVSEQNAAKNSD